MQGFPTRDIQLVEVRSTAGTRTLAQGMPCQTTKGFKETKLSLSISFHLTHAPIHRPHTHSTHTQYSSTIYGTGGHHKFSQHNHFMCRACPMQAAAYVWLLYCVSLSPGVGPWQGGRFTELLQAELLKAIAPCTHGKRSLLY